MQFDKGNVINKMWQMQCDKHNVKSVIWQMKCDKWNVTESSVIIQIKCDKFIVKKQKDKWNMKNAAWQMHCNNMINTGWSAGSDKNYALITWARKQPISWDRCPFVH